MNDIHTTALDRFALAKNYDHNQRRLAVEDMLFAHSEDGQWTEDATTKRGDRPRYTFNRVIGVIKQITGAHKQNRSRIKVAPDGNGADDKTAEILNGIIRKIEKAADAQSAYDNAFDEKVAGGYGGWRVLTEFQDDSFNQQVIIEPIVSACTSHFLDPSSVKITGKDANWQFLTMDMDIEAFKAKYPKATVTDFDHEQFRSGNCEGWFRDSKIRIAEYWVKTPIDKTILLLSDGRVIDKTDDQAALDELAEKGITVQDERKAKSHKVEMYKMNGAEILEGPNEHAGKYIPLIPDIGERIIIEERRITRGIVRFSKDSNRTYNYARSTDIETYALTPKDPYFLTTKMAAAHVKQFNDFPKKNQPFMKYTPDPAHQGPPSRSGAPSVPAAGIEISRQSIDDMHATTSMYPPAMGNAPQLLSEKSVRSQAEKGDIGAYVYQDNHEKALAYTGQILVDLIPRIMDAAQVTQIIGLDGVAEEVKINQSNRNAINEEVIDEETGEPVLVNDLSLGKYSVSVETGPAFSTQREESVDQLLRIADSLPQLGALVPDLIAKNMNIVEGDEFAKRARKFAITQGIADPTDDEIKELGLDQPQEPDSQAVALENNVNAQTKKIQVDTELQDAKTQETLVKTQGETVSAYKDLLDTFKAQVEMGIELSPQQRNLIIMQGDIVADAQDMIRDGEPNSEQAEDLERMAAQGQV